MTGSKKHIVMVGEYINADANSTGEYFFDILLGFLKNDCQVTVVAPETKLNKEAIFELRNSFAGQLNTSFVFPAQYSHGQSIGKAVGSIKLTLSLWKQVKKEVRDGTVLFFGTNPAFLVLMSGLWPVRRSVKKILLCYDLFPDNLIALSKNWGIRFASKLVQPLFKFSYRGLDRVLVIGRCMAEHVKGFGIQEQKISVISNWADGEEIFPKSDPALTQNSVRFQFFGNMGSLQGIRQLLDSFKYVNASNAQFTFIGRGADVELVESFIKENNTVVRVQLKAGVAKQERSDVLNDCDVAVVSLRDEVTGLGVPSKTYYSLAAGKPILVLANPNAEPSILVSEFDIGWHACLGDAKAIAATIDTICNSQKMPSTAHIRSVFEKRFSKRIGVAKVVEEVCH
ncbi:glycosyltransferase family 4 protein [Idiomarina seosinensis]|uniref:Glycosyltransferase subfamily 4-like N-terminal domain-containing protein n=1 Tax=Idiomarina seosinensis TaxID=281739 RepID=A0A432ZG98_9GAMM|nr:glycosyltransferase family 4 protein [Idiomarina seosinensis]RUO76961.1 hypothetical protein CWI81_00175 [Idiomarina seosinensis]